jgi:hypothetical protein
VRTKIKAVILAVALMLGVTIASATPAQAHQFCAGEYANKAGKCNVVINLSNVVGIGIYDWSSSSSWSWVLGGWGYARSDGRNTYQADVGGFWIGAGWCAYVTQSNDNATWGYYGTIRGPVRFKTDYWSFNRVNPFMC